MKRGKLVTLPGRNGAGLVVSLQNYGANIGEWVTVITGGIFVVCALAFRRGIVGKPAALFKK